MLNKRLKEIKAEIEEIQNDIDDQGDKEVIKNLKKSLDILHCAQAYLTYIVDNNRIPTLDGLNKYGITREFIRQRFSRLEMLHEYMQREYNNCFDNLFIERDFTEIAWQKSKNEIKQHAKKHKKFVVFSAEPGVGVAKHCYETVKKHLFKKGYMALVLPTSNDLINLSSDLKNENTKIILGDVNLNSNIKLSPVVSSITSVKPTSGLARIGERSCSTIYPSTKLSKEPISTDFDKMPHLILTPGAITEALYNKRGNTLLKKSEYIAENDHELSALLIEVQDENIFFETELMFDLDGSFLLLDPKNGFSRHLPNGKVVFERPLSITLGDLHAEEISAETKVMNEHLIKVCKPLEVHLHDVHSYLSMNHHTMKSPITNALIAAEGLNDPTKGYVAVARVLDDMKKVAPKDTEFLFVDSNHDDFMVKAVDTGLLNTPEHKLTYHLVSTAILLNHNPLEWGLKNFANYECEKFKFLRRCEKKVFKNKFGELACHFHGDKGNKGSKNASSNNNSGIALSSGCANLGHIHGARILPGNSLGGKGNGGVWYSGTSQCTYGDDLPEYAKDSPNDWTQTVTFTFGLKNGRFLRCQITNIGGSFSVDYKAAKYGNDRRFFSNKDLANMKASKLSVRFAA